MTTHRLTIIVDYELPDNPTELRAAYGTTNPLTCWHLDFDTDPAATLLESCNIVSVAVTP